MAQRSTKVLFFQYKEVSGRNGDHEWLRMTNAFILCNLVQIVQKSHAVNREGSFKYHILGYMTCGFTRLRHMSCGNITCSYTTMRHMECGYAIPIYY